MKTILAFSLDSELVEALKERFQNGQRSDYINYLLSKKILK